ncbi:MAG TPA: hypothetical protein VFG45_10325 [Candidatus Nitrosocosmicus sp.]|nr:hypothetical protein [Candidatus Nitrosocosmicus sp.]
MCIVGVVRVYLIIYPVLTSAARKEFVYRLGIARVGSLKSSVTFPVGTSDIPVFGSKEPSD